MSKSFADFEARRRIATDLSTTFLVEAAAGSGKTTCLVQRMLALISTGSCRIEHLAAITFTRKAAAELKGRFQIRLEEALRKTTDLEERARLSHALSNLHLAFLGTIHSFCSRLLRERPVEAGLTPDFSEIEGIEETLLQERAWQDYLNRVKLEAPAKLSELSDLDIRPDDLRAAFTEICLYPDVTMVAEVAPYPDLTAVRRKLLDVVAIAAPFIPADQPEGGWDDLQKIIRKCQRWMRAFDLNEDKYLLRLLAQIDKEGKAVQKRWVTKDGAKSAQAAFAEFREQHLQPALQEWREYRHYPLLSFLLPAAEHYSSLRQREQKLNFQDLLMRTAALLRHNSEVRRYFQERFTHLLVDEFQDTDPIQAEIMMFLTGSDPAETDWNKATPRPGSLFVVGDPKQSIYRFRRADITIYNRVKALISASGGEVLHLNSNFRSLPRILDKANHAFKDLFNMHSTLYQADFVSISPVREKGLPTEGIRLIEIPEVPHNKQEDIALEDASAIAAHIRHALDGGLTLSRTDDERARHLTERPVPADFLILVRYKAHMAYYARALEEYNIPFTLSGGSDIRESRELADLLTLLRALADPTDTLSIVAVLRGSFFGLNDLALYLHKQANGSFNYYTPVPEHPASASFTAAFNTLQTFRSFLQCHPPSSAIERIIRELGLIPLALSGELAKGRTGYLLQALELIRTQEQGQTFLDIVDYLEELLSAGVEDELDIEGMHSPGVRIMNLHRAKGLEAPVVFLANPGRSVEHPATFHVVRGHGAVPVGVELTLREAAAESAAASQGSGAYGYICITRQKDQYSREVVSQPPGWATHAQEEDSYLSAEENRLLYVAATRAKNLLVVSTYPKKPEKSPWQPLEPFISDEAVIEIPQVEPPEIPLPELSITPALLANTRRDITESLATLSQPTYRGLTVTDLAKQGKAPIREATGKGASWGNVIHQCLELLAKNQTPHLPNILTANGRDPLEEQQVSDLLSRVTATPIWHRAMAVAERHTEVPFGIRTDTLYLTGVIDLAFREPDGWVLVDFKSDHIIDDAHLVELTTYYTPQIRTYAERFTEITGERVKERGLLFTEKPVYVKV